MHTVIGRAALVGTDIYLFGGYKNNTKAYKYNSLTDTYTQLSNIPYSFANGSAIALGTDVYLFGSSETGNTGKVYKYDTITDTYTQLTDIPFPTYYASVVVLDTNIYLLGGTNNYTRVQVYSVQGTEYEQDNVAVIIKGNNGINTYDVKLYDNPKDINSPKYQIKDAYFYTLENGLDGTMPVYYGDGTQWINIKNPPQNDGGEE